jgi:hypothetical protein
MQKLYETIGFSIDFMISLIQNLKTIIIIKIGYGLVWNQLCLVSCQHFKTIVTLKFWYIMAII